MRILTTDIYEGAYLLSKGAELKNIWRDDGNKKRSVIFEFNGVRLELLRENYLLGKANANVLRLKQNLNILKDQLFKLIREIEIENRKREGDRKSPQFCKAKQTGGLRKEIENEVHRIPVTRVEK